MAVGIPIPSLSPIRSHFRKASIHNTNIEFTQKTFHNLSQSPFTGKPSPAIDASWDDLLAPMNIRVIKAELDGENVDSIALPEGGRYLSWITAFHQLHCINMVRKWLHPDYYHAGMTPSEKKHMESHVGKIVLAKNKAGGETHRPLLISISRSLHRLPPPNHSLSTRPFTHHVQMGPEKDKTDVQRFGVETYMR
ncbi:MAG: hypothetical protein Q9168_006020 [Polycauliona sp. 1 TL-2023]